MAEMTRARAAREARRTAQFAKFRITELPEHGDGETAAVLGYAAGADHVRAGRRLGAGKAQGRGIDEQRRVIGDQQIGGGESPVAHVGGRR